MSRSVEELAREAYAALNRRDLDAFMALIHPEIEFRSLVAEAEGTSYRGHDGIRDWWDRMEDAFQNLTFVPAVIHDMGDRGYAELIVTGTVEGVEVPQRMYQAFILRDGKPVWWQSCRTEAEAVDRLTTPGADHPATQSRGGSTVK